MNIIVDYKNLRTIQYKELITLDCYIASIQHLDYPLDYLMIVCHAKTEIDNLFIKYDDLTEFYFIDNSILIHFPNEKYNYQIQKIPKSYREFVQKEEKIVVVSLNCENKVDYFFESTNDLNVY